MSNQVTYQPGQPQSQVAIPRAVSHIQRAKVYIALRQLGADEYDIWLPETRYLSQLLRPDEVLLGAVYGRYEKPTLPHTGRGLMVITDYRLLLVDKKPLYVQYDDLRFDMVSGVQYAKALISETITLNARMGNITMRTFNDRCARHFVETVEDLLCTKDWGSYGQQGRAAADWADASRTALPGHGR